ncbi:uncharacterized protein [Parasteatoda tepidariorum]|uniref:uncharacterized protein n=1 Tax=Parasteatoda tepidariorum TaxID=114398 RepID=UPI0039BCBD8D
MSRSADYCNRYPDAPMEPRNRSVAKKTKKVAESSAGPSPKYLAAGPSRMRQPSSSNEESEEEAGSAGHSIGSIPAPKLRSRKRQHAPSDDSDEESTSSKRRRTKAEQKEVSNNLLEYNSFTL